MKKNKNKVPFYFEVLLALFLILSILILGVLLVKDISNFPKLEYKITKEVCFNQLQQKSSEQIYLSPLDSEYFYENITYKVLDYNLIEDEAVYHFCATKVNEKTLEIFLGYYEIYPTRENSIKMDIYNSTVSCSYLFYKSYDDLYLDSNFIINYEFEEYNKYFQNNLFNASKIEYLNLEEYGSRIFNTNYWYSVILDISYPIKEVTICGTQEVEEILILDYSYEGTDTDCFLAGSNLEERGVFVKCKGNNNNRTISVYKNIPKSEITQEWLEENCEINFTDWDCHKCGGGKCCSSSPIYKCGDYQVEVLR